MAEALAVVGLVSAIVQFVDYGGKVLSRLNEYKQTVDKAPKTIQKLSTQLPILIRALSRTKDLVADGDVSEEEARDVMGAVKGCLDLVKKLEGILVKSSPSENDSSWARRRKALASLGSDKDVEEILANITSYMSHLTFFWASSPFRPTAVFGTSQPTPSVETGRQPCFMLTYHREENFTGRGDVIEEIDRRFAAGQRRVAITGMGGIGKSQIAIEYCYRYQKDHPEADIFWVHGSNHARFVGAYNEIARQLALPDADRPEVDKVQLVLKWLNSDLNRPWLLVLDNADDMETFFHPPSPELPNQAAPDYQALVDYLPRSSTGAMIITTRDRRIGERLAKREKPISVLQFSMVDAKCLLRKTLLEDNLNEKDSAALLEALEFVPMAITQAAAFIRENGISLLDFLNTLLASSTEAKDLLAETYYELGRDLESRNSVFHTWKISFESIRKQNPRAAEILSLMAVLDRQAVQEKLIREKDERKIDFTTAIGTLKAFSLITEDKEGGTFGMHRLIQLSTQRWLELENTTSQWQERALNMVYQYCSEDGRGYNWKPWEAVNPHVQVVLGFEFRKESCLLQHARLMHSAALYDLEQDRLVEADAKAAVVLAVRERILGKDHPFTLSSSNTVAILLLRQGKLEESNQRQQEVLKKSEEIFGPNNLDTLSAVNNLAEVYLERGDYDGAEALYRRTLEGTIASSGPTDPATLRRMAGLASVLSMQDNFEEARTLAQQAFDGYTNLRGVDHPSTLSVLQLLSSILEKEGKYAAAEDATRQALLGLEKAFGLNHRWTMSCRDSLVGLLRYQGRQDEIKTMNRLLLEEASDEIESENASWLVAPGIVHRQYRAEILAEEGRFDEAEKMGQQLVLSCGNTLGPGNLRTLSCLWSLVTILQMQGKFEAAESKARQVLEGFEKLCGPTHSRTLSSMGKVAFLLELQGKYEAAEEMVQKVAESSEKLFGPKHPSTLNALYALSRVLEKQDKIELAETICGQALQGFESTIGNTHSFIGLVLDYLINILSRQFQFEKAYDRAQLTVDALVRELGSDHATTVLARCRLFMLLERQGKFEAAEVLGRQLLDDLGKAFGPDHSFTLEHEVALASVLVRQSKFEEAHVSFSRLLEALEKKFGPGDPATFATIGNIALVLAEQAKYVESEALYRKLLDYYKTTVGMDHKSTLMVLSSLAHVLERRTMFTEAETMRRSAIEGQEKTLGPEHVDTLLNVYNLGHLLRKLNRVDEASLLFQRALSGLQKSLDPNHPHTLLCSKSIALLTETNPDQQMYQVRPTTLMKYAMRFKRNLGRLGTYRSTAETNNINPRTLRKAH